MKNVQKCEIELIVGNKGEFELIWMEKKSFVFI